MRNLSTALLGVIFLAVAVLIAGMLFGWTGPVFNLLQSIGKNTVYSAGAAIGCLVLAVLLFYTASLPGTERAGVLTASRYGQIYISERTIEDIVSRAGLNVEGIKEITPRVFPKPEGINIEIQVIMRPEQVIPQVSEELQSVVKSNVENYTQLKVAEVKVMVRGIESVTAVRIR